MIDHEENIGDAKLLGKITRIVSPLAVVRQHAVGHGGFHTGALGLEKPEIRWIYDCGAWHKPAKARLSDCIKSYSEHLGRKGEVDLLFISHFDVDHTNGIRELLRNTRVNTAIVPYLEPEEIFGVVAEAAAKGATARDIRSLGQALVDPKSWFGNRRVARVIRLRSGASESEPFTIETPPFQPTDSHIYKLVLARTDRSIISYSGSHGLVEDVDPGLIGRIIAANGRETDWSFVPFVHPVSLASRQALQESAEETVGTSIENANFGPLLLALLGSKSGIRKLREIYTDRELSDANGKSLSLYVGPLIGALRRAHAPRPNGNHGSGWLLTGDAKLRNRERRAEWMRHYRAIPRHLIGNLMIPHHGAAGNFHIQILSISPTSNLFATVDEADRLRPNEDIISEMQECGDTRVVIRVTEDPISELMSVSGSDDYVNHRIVRSKEFNNWV